MPNVEGSELYELIQRLLRLQETRLESRMHREHAMYEMRAKEMQWREQDIRLEQETRETFRALREKLGVPESVEAPDAPFDPAKLNLEELFAQFGMKKNEPPLR